MRTALPIDSRLKELVCLLQRHTRLVLEAPPGAGKTTRVPLALLSQPGEIWVLEPRRIAARLAARRVAEELGETVGQTVGYQVRLEEVSGPRTRIRFLTEGVLVRRLLSDRYLSAVSTVILDEFHERHLDADLSLALLRRLQAAGRPDLRIVVMSATLDAERLARTLDAPRLRCEGRLYPLEIRYAPGTVEAALATLPRTGDALIFLPGAREIRAAMEQCAAVVRQRGALALPLYGELSPEEQDRAVLPAGQPKVIFATNVAETSLTIEGVTAVVDSGLARIARDSPWTGLPSLTVSRISQASAIQRAGRAARTGPGLAIRLYSQEDFARRPAQERPEILRRELSSLLLTLRALDLEPAELPWIDPPPAEALTAAARLLDQLRADPRLLRYPVPPRLARLMVDAGRDGAREAARLLRDDRLAQLETRPGRVDLPRALLRAFPDRVAKRLRGDEYLLAAGGSALAPEQPADWIVALEIEERPERGLPHIREAAAIDPNWLLDEFPDRITEQELMEWNREAERVDAVRRLEFDRLTILEDRGAPSNPSELLAAKAREAGLERFLDATELAQFRARAEFAGEPLTPEELDAWLTAQCAGRRSFAELAGLSLASLRPGLDQQAPPTWQLPNGRRVRIFYAPGQTPWIASRLQDFFGMRTGPQLRGVPLVIHLLAPNQRPVQMTQDLAGFWERLYPQLRREFMRRYPKHHWPEDPLEPQPRGGRPAR